MATTKFQMHDRPSALRRNCSSNRQSHRLPRRLYNWLRSMNPFIGINWKEVRKAYSVFISNPSQGILHILAAEQRSNWQRWVIERLAKQAPHLQYVDLKISVKELLELPEDTLGGAYARHIISQDFDPEAFVTSEHTNWIDYRAALSHDVYHIIAGFDGSPIGEFGLAAFALVQYRDLLNVFVLSHFPWFLIGNIKSAPQAIAAVSKGLLRGIRCQPVFAYPFEQNWQKPISQVRQELGIA
jgi:Coenzyme Q (ubiquinone) biosynthesis protein Coq4